MLVFHHPTPRSITQPLCYTSSGTGGTARWLSRLQTRSRAALGFLKSEPAAPLRPLGTAQASRSCSPTSGAARRYWSFSRTQMSAGRPAHRRQERKTTRPVRRRSGRRENGQREVGGAEDGGAAGGGVVIGRGGASSFLFL